MNAQELKKWLSAQGCTFETKKGGSGHLVVRRGDRKSELPMHGGRKELWHRPRQCDQEAIGTEMMRDFRIDLVPDDNGTFLVNCPQLPMVATFGDTGANALHHAIDAVETALASMIDDGEEVPVPDGSGNVAIRLPLLTSLKLNVYWALRTAGITRAELARPLHWKRESVDRLFRLDHASRLEQIEAVFQASGRSIDVDIREAA